MPKCGVVHDEVVSGNSINVFRKKLSYACTETIVECSELILSTFSSLLHSCIPVVLLLLVIFILSCHFCDVREVYKNK